MPYVMGTGLEARVQRLFLAQGVHAERNIIIRTARKDSRMATDVDVLAIAYAANFHPSVFHAECKGEKNAKVLERSFWLAGVRSLLSADRSLLVLPSYDRDSSDFARQLGIETLAIETLAGLEASYQVPHDWWPGRSDFERWDQFTMARATVVDKYSLRGYAIDELAEICSEYAWKPFNYATLNRTLRLIASSCEELSRVPDTEELQEFYKFYISAGLVRFSHYMLNVCQDLVSSRPTDRKAYLEEKLVFGDSEPYKTKRMVNGWINMVKSELAQYSIPFPERWTPGLFLAAPAYHQTLLAFIEKLLAQPERSIFLPLAMEMVQFGHQEEPRGEVRKWVDAGRPIAESLKAFFVQEMGVNASLLAPVDSERFRITDDPLGQEEHQAAKNAKVKNTGKKQTATLFDQPTGQD